MLPHFIFAFFPLLSLLSSVAAHGYVTQVSIDGTSYSGNSPLAKPSDSPIRQVSDIFPVMGTSNPSMNCGLNAQLATMVVPANPGSVMEFYWGGLGGIIVRFFVPYAPFPSNLPILLISFPYAFFFAVVAT
jgi:hypothetical protein